MKKLCLLLALVLTLTTMGGIVTGMAEEAPMELIFFDASGATWETSPLMQKMEETYNVKITRQSVTSSEDASYYTLMIAADNAPDYMPNVAVSDYVNYARQGVFKEIPIETIKEYGPELYDWLIDEGGENIFAYGDVDGVNYGIPILWSLTNHWSSLAIRQDLAEMAGVPELPTTLDELETTVKAIYDYQNGEKYIISGEGDFYSLFFIAGAYNVFLNIFYKDENGQLAWGEFHPNAKAAITRMHEWYANGWVDPESITNTYDMIFEKVVNGDLAMVQSYWCDFASGNAWAGMESGMKSTLENNNPDANLVAIGALPGPEGYQGFPRGNTLSSGFMCFRSDLEDEKMNMYIKLFSECSMEFDWLELGMKGVEGETFTKDENGNYAWTEAYSTEDARGQIALGRIYPGNFNNYTAQYPFQTNNLGVDERHATEDINVCVTNIMQPFYREVWAEYGAAFTDYQNKNLIDFITGERSVDEYDDFVNECMTQYHGKEIMDEAQVLFDKYFK